MAFLIYRRCWSKRKDYPRLRGITILTRRYPNWFNIFGRSSNKYEKTEKCSANDSRSPLVGQVLDMQSFPKVEKVVEQEKDRLSAETNFCPKINIKTRLVKSLSTIT